RATMRATMNLLPRIAVTSAALVLLVTSFACNSSSESGGGVKVYCAKTEHGCRCKNETFDLESDEVAVDACPAGAWQCCHDLDAAGESTTCECSTYLCVQTPTSAECNCDFVPAEMTLFDDDVVQTNCKKTPT